MLPDFKRFKLGFADFNTSLLLNYNLFYLWAFRKVVFFLQTNKEMSFEKIFILKHQKISV